MNGREVFRHAVQKISGVIEETLVMTGYAPTRSTSTCRIRPTSASSTASPSGSASPPSKIVVTLAKHGNTSAASIPLALNQAFEDHRLERAAPGADGGHGRRLHLGCRAGALVKATPFDLCV